MRFAIQIPGVLVPPSLRPGALPANRETRLPTTRAGQREAKAAERYCDAFLSVLRDRRRLPTSARTASALAGEEQLIRSLETALRTITLPVPIIVHGEFTGPNTVRLELDLPPMAAMPALWLRQKPRRCYCPVSRTKRRALYYHVCSCVALRIAYEACRSLPSLQEIRVIGMRPGVDPATPPKMDSEVLRLDVHRDVLLGTDLDGENAHAILLDLGGDMSVMRGDDFVPLADAS